jgi:hypothetical protein
MKYRIKIFSDFYSSENLKNIYENINEVDKMENYGSDKDIYITIDDDYTHALIINFGMPELKDIPKQNVVGLAHEPTIFIMQRANDNKLSYIKNNIGKYFIGDTIFEEPFITNFSYMVYNTPLSYKPIKKKLMSIIISEKCDLWFGYRYRYKIVDLILRNNLPIDIYGRGTKNFKHLNNEYVKDEFSHSEPYLDYTFHICIENFITDHYFSEKIMNPLMTSTIPIYLGCRNIKEYFGDNVITMSGSVEKDIDLLIDITNNPHKYVRNIDVESVKKKVSLLHNLDSIFS